MKFTEHFPEVEDLAAASEEEVLKLWQGLGYYSRARNLHATARTVSWEYEGCFPDSYRELLKLKGVGPYTAAAIASICYDLPHPVVDGNVYRVLSRYFGVQIPINSTEGIRHFASLAAEVIDRDRPGEYNQALMEFGALQCIPQNPDCQACPLSGSCEAFARNQVSDLPQKLPKKKVRQRTFNYVMPVDPQFRTRLVKRKGKGIWQGLFEFPLIETREDVSDAEIISLLKTTGFHDMATPRSVVRFNATPLVHKLSHQHLRVTFWILHLDGPLDPSVPISEMQSYPVPVLIANFMETVKNSYF